ncbi:MAG: hypothetical protein OXN84_20840 [Albidovulum sp.]|nr:hypothetical protein [Albidovulum sp.]
MSEANEAAPAARKWDKNAAVLGFCSVPSPLLRAQSWLGLKSTQFSVLMPIANFRRDGERKPVLG